MSKLSVLLAMTLLCTAANASTVQFQSLALNNKGTPVQEVSVGESLTLVVSVADVRDTALGVFSAFLDIEFDSSLAQPLSNTLTHSVTFGSGVHADFASSGLIDDVGGVDGVTALGAGEYELFRVDFTALDEGMLQFLGSPADEMPSHATTVIGQATAVPASEMTFVNAVVTIVPEPSSWVLSVFAILLPLFARRQT